MWPFSLFQRKPKLQAFIDEMDDKSFMRTYQSVSEDNKLSSAIAVFIMHRAGQSTTKLIKESVKNPPRFDSVFIELCAILLFSAYCNYENLLEGIDEYWEFEWDEYDAYVVESANIVSSLIKSMIDSSIDMLSTINWYIENIDQGKSAFDLFYSRLIVSSFPGRGMINNPMVFETALAFTFAQIFFTAWYDKAPEFAVRLFMAHKNGDLE